MQIVSETGAAQLADTWMAGNDGDLLHPRPRIMEGYDFLDYNILTERLGYTVDTGEDIVDSQFELSLADRINTVAHMLGEYNLSDEEILEQLGFVQSGIRTHFSNDLHRRIPGDGPMVVGTGKERHHIVQPEIFFEWAVRASGDRVLAAGILREGSVLYAVSAPPDGVPEFSGLGACFVLFITSYDQTFTCRGIPVALLKKSRMPVTLSKETGWALKHTKNMAEKVEGFVAEWSIMTKVWRRAIDQMDRMSKIQCDFTELVDVYYENDSENTRSMNSRDDMWRAYHLFVTDEFKGTLFGAYEALVGYDGVIRGTHGTDDRTERQMSHAVGQDVWMKDGMAFLNKKLNEQNVVEGRKQEKLFK